MKIDVYPLAPNGPYQAVNAQNPHQVGIGRMAAESVDNLYEYYGILETPSDLHVYHTTPKPEAKNAN